MGNLLLPNMGHLMDFQPTYPFPARGQLWVVHRHYVCAEARSKQATIQIKLGH